MQAGLDLVTVARRAGHESVRTVADIYARAIEGEQRPTHSSRTRAAAVISAATRSRPGHAEVTVTDLGARRKQQNGR